MARWIVFGATGRTGRLVVERALLGGHEVTAFLRNRNHAAFEARPLLTLAEGDVTDAGAVAAAIRGHDAVICVLGAPASSPDHVREVGTVNIVRGMRASGVRRVVVQSTYGLGDSKKNLPWFVRNLVVPLYLHRAFHDHEVQEAVLRASELDWTVLQPPFLVDEPISAPVRFSGLDDKATPPRWKISRHDVANLLVQRAADGDWSRRAVPVTW